MAFLDYYRDNLSYIRVLAAEFGSEFPKIASRLNLSNFDCQDPYVERLLEGTAFLSARVEKKLDDGYKRLLESILTSVAPDALYPIASGSVLEFSVDCNDETLKKGYTLPEFSFFDSFIPSINTPCRFSTLYCAPLSPVIISHVEYVTRDLGRFNIRDAQAVSALYMKISIPSKALLADVSLDELLFYINLPDAVASMLLRQIMQDRTNVYVSNENGDFSSSTRPCFEMSASLGEGSLYAGLKGNASGLRMLQNFLAYPAFMKFFKIKNLGSLLNKKVSEVEIVITFKRREPELVNEIKATSLKLNCIPALNIFKKRSDRIFLEKDAFGLHIIPERTAMRDFEVCNVQRLEFFNEKNEPVFCALPFYKDDFTVLKSGKRHFFSTHRNKSLFSKKASQRTSYGGTEVFVSLSCPDESLQEVDQFSADLLCTNRDLPLLLQPNALLSSNEPFIKNITFVTPPSRPDYPLIEHGSQSDFAKISHIVFNLSGMLWQNGTFPLEMLKTLLRNYTLRSEEETERLLDAIISLSSQPTTFRFIRNGSVFFEMGWKIDLTLDEQACAGTGFYVFAFVLKELLQSFTPLNSLLEIDLYTQQSGYVTTWKTLESG